MKNDKSTKMLLLATLFLFLLSPLETAKADAWWGNGRRDEDWVLRHGGTIIKYTIKDKEDSEDYKVRMYLLGEFGAGGRAANTAEKGDVIETEIGGRGTIDDAINNTYKLIVFKGSSKKADTTVTARPGQEITVEFDLKKGNAKTSSRVRVPLGQIQLNSQSEKYISPAMLGSQPKRTVTGLQAARNEPKTKEEPKQNRLSEEEKLSREKRLAELNAKAKATGKELELKEQLFQERAAHIETKLKELEQPNALWYWLWGPQEKTVRSLENDLASNQDKVLELRQLGRQAPNDELTNRIKEKISDFQQQNDLARKKIRAKKAELDFWNRTKNFFS